MQMTSPSSPSEWIKLLFDRFGLSEQDIRQALDLPDDVSVTAVTSGAYQLTATDLAAAADLLSVPVAMLTGRLPMERHFGVSLRLGNVTTAEVPADALSYVERVFEYRALLDSWLGHVPNPLAGVDMSYNGYFKKAGEESAQRVRDALQLGVEPIPDLVGLVESFGIPVIFMNLPGSIHGLNIRDEREGTPSRIVVITTADKWVRQRFTLAHELCHAVYDDEDQMIIDRVEVPDQLPELRAESFARHLLLPQQPLRAEVLKGRRRHLPWTTIVPLLMMTWGISRLALLRALTDDGLASAADLKVVSDARIIDLMAEAGLSQEWAELSASEHEKSGSPWMVERAIRAYGNGWVALNAVADLLGKDPEATEAELSRQGWDTGRELYPPTQPM